MEQYGGAWLLENPKSSQAWKQPELQGLLERGYVTEVDQCMYGLMSSSGRPHRKPTRFLASHPELLFDLERRCDQSHSHDLVMGGPSVTTRTGHYPEELAKSIVKGVQKLWSQKEALNVDELN